MLTTPAGCYISVMKGRSISGRKLLFIFIPPTETAVFTSICSEMQHPVLQSHAIKLLQREYVCIYMTKNPNKASFSCSFIPRVSTTTASSAYLSFTLSVLSRKSKQKVKLFANTVLHWFTSYTSSQHFWNLVCQSKYMILHEGSLNMKSWIQQAPPQTSALYIE